MTAFEYQLHPVGQMLGGCSCIPLPRPKTSCFYRDYTSEADELSAAAGVLTAPDGNLAAIVVLRASRRAKQSFYFPSPSMTLPILDLIRPMTYTDIQNLLYVFQAGMQNYWKVDFLQGLTGEALDTIVAYAATKTSPMTVALFPINSVASRVARRPPFPTANIIINS